MIISPDTTTRIANSESVMLSLDVEAPLVSVELQPRFGDAVTIDLADGAFEFPKFDVPNTVQIKWMDNSGVQFTSVVELVSRHYFTLEQLRTYNCKQDGFDDEDLFPIESLWMARAAATDTFEQAARRSFVHRIGRTKDYGRERMVTLDHGDVYELLTDGYTQVSDSILQTNAQQPKPYPRWIEYLYGTDSMPAEVSRAVLELAAYILRPSNRPVGATGESSDAGYIHFTVAGRDGATAIPEVNAAIEQFGRGEIYVW